MEGKKLMYDALMAQCEAERTEALFTLNNYMENSVGIGEHPQQVEEAMKALEKLTESKDKVKVLEQYFSSREENKKIL
jgi:succinate dehydrogenase/fumarate reductase flavoprotein subunit